MREKGISTSTLRKLCLMAYLLYAVTGTMAETRVATKENLSYELITRSGGSITSVTPISTGQTVAITEGESFRVRLTKSGSDTTRWGATTYWHLSSNTPYETNWPDQALVYAPWSFWRDGDRVNISNGLYLPHQDSIKSWSTTGLVLQLLSLRSQFQATPRS